MFLDWLESYWYIPAIITIVIILIASTFLVYKRYKSYESQPMNKLFEKLNKPELSSDDQFENPVDTERNNKPEVWPEKKPYNSNNFKDAISYVDELANQIDNWLDKIAYDKWSHETNAAYRFQLEYGIIQKTKDELTNENLGPDIIEQIYAVCNLPENYSFPHKEYVVEYWFNVLNSNIEPDISIDEWRKYVAEARQRIIESSKQYFLENPVDLINNQNKHSYSDVSLSDYEQDVKSFQQSLEASLKDFSLLASIKSQIYHMDITLETREQTEVKNAIESPQSKLLAQQRDINELMEISNDSEARDLLTENQKNVAKLNQLNPQ